MMTVVTTRGNISRLTAKRTAGRTTLVPVAVTRRPLPTQDDGDGDGDDARARARRMSRMPSEAGLLGVDITSVQLARAIRFRFKRRHIPRLAEIDGRIHFLLELSTDDEPAGYDDLIGNVVHCLNKWRVGETVFHSIMDNRGTPKSRDDDIVLDVKLEVRTSGVMSAEWIL